MSPAATRLIEKYSFRSYLIILSVINLNVVVAGALMKSPTVKSTVAYEDEQDSSKDINIQNKSFVGRKR